MSGFILYEGKSLIDGENIVVIATDSSSNVKTGGMVQTWIMRTDIEPHKALKTGQDSSVCGDCPHRPVNGGACYVTVFQAPLSVYRAYKRGRYGMAKRGQFAGRMVRIGSYGDPAAVPVSVWADYVADTKGHTGYSHQWRTAPLELSRYCMASCDSPADFAEARHMGWRTFRVRLESEERLPGEAICPASAEAGHKLNCDTCGACRGNDGKRRGGITIIAHGAASKVRAFEKFKMEIA